MFLVPLTKGYLFSSSSGVSRFGERVIRGSWEVSGDGGGNGDGSDAGLSVSIGGGGSGR